jgi:phosphoglycerol transferase MdoB-like AlkP superfamily enzyme
MLVKWRFPNSLLWILNVSMLFLGLFTFYRIVTLIAFGPEFIHWKNIPSSFLLGLRFDLRWISILIFPIIIASIFTRLSPFYSLKNKKVWTIYLAVVSFIVFFFFAADFGCFSYNKTRLNASALNFVEDPKTSASMLWQSYPIVWMIFALFFVVVLLKNMFKKLHRYVELRSKLPSVNYNRNWFILATILFSFFTYGSISSQPLKWNNAFQLNDTFDSYLALNPLQNFFTTLKFRTPEFSDSKVKKYYPVLNSWMSFNKSQMDFTRKVQPFKNSIGNRPNVVLVLCESFSMYKSSMSGNVLNTTPFFQSMCDSGVFFNRCFTPHFSTARGLFATVTGIPDVQLSKFSIRNPEAIDQHTIINDFKGYKKLYFLGGNPNFNNFEGLIKNIDNVEIHAEGNFKHQAVNVWGISDNDLFQEANSNFAAQKSPFFAIIQTADNHRPFTIPANEKDFKINTVDEEELKKNGFESIEEYNAFRYSDFCFKQFIQTAKKEAYFKNTIFVFIGDHGVNGNADVIYSPVWTNERLTEEHVPFLIYAPALITPQLRTETISQIDVLPTLAGLTGQTYTNTTLGRDVLHNENKNHFAFTILHDEGKIGIITDNYYFTKNLNFNKEELFSLNDKKSISKRESDSIRMKLSTLTSAFYETSKWMLVHNKKSLSR